VPKSQPPFGVPATKLTFMTGKQRKLSVFSNYLNRSKRLVSVLFIGLCFPAIGYSQEICNNGIDDDSDNLIDVYDPDCPCDNQTLLCTPSCQFAIPGGPLNFNSQWQSADEVPIYQTPLVADMDRDGVPDLIIMSSNSLIATEPRRAKDIILINGSTGATMLTISTPFMAWVGPDPYAVADIDNDGFGEIIVASIDHTDNALGDRRYLYCYEHTGALKWKSDVQYGYTPNAKYGSPIGIADFNSDGIAEVYVYNQIFNARTGKKLAEGGAGNGLGLMTNQGFGDLANPAAANLTNHPGLELAAGKSVYNVTITNTSGLAGNSMTAITIAGQPDGYTSLADIDLDGNMDVVVASQGATGKIYVWSPNNGSPVLIASRNLPNTGGNWIGVPFIGDMDKDCQPEIGVTRAQRVYALDYDGSGTLALKWTLVTTDASGFTGITMFDFNQDGTQELVYRDESTLRIIDGSGATPVTIGTNPCSSGTGSDMPVVADVDGDGQAEICVTCATTGVSKGRVNVFESAAQPWAPCRNIWNQYSYFNVNINNNLSIPIQQQQHSVLLSTVTCPFYSCSENRPFNSFMAQSTFLTQDGCPIYPASDVALSISSSQCSGSTILNLDLLVTNVGSAPSDPNYQLQFYSGNPLIGNATLITTTPSVIQTSGIINSGQNQHVLANLNIKELPKPFNLFILLNDAGALAPPFSYPLSTLPECDFSDNVASLLNVNCCAFGDLAIQSILPPLTSICQGVSTSFTANAISSAGLDSSIYSWTLPNNTTQAGQTITTSNGGNYTIQVIDDASCIADSTFTVSVIPLPTPSSTGANQTVCSDATALEGNIPSIGIGTWSLLSGAGIVANPASATSQVSGLGVGLNRFVWSIINGGLCVSSDTLDVTRLPEPTVPLAGADQSVCSTTATLAGNIPTTGDGTWTLVSGSGTITDPSASGSSVTGLGVGNSVFQWTIRNGICAPKSDQVIITRFTPPTVVNAGSNQTICSSTGTLAATPASIGNGTWSVISGGATVANPTNPASGFSGLTDGPNIFRWTIRNGTCPAISADVTITKELAPTTANAGTNQQVCQGTATLTANTPLVGTGVWTVFSGSASINNPALSSTSVSGLNTGTTTFRWTISNGVCPPSFSNVTITRDVPPSAADAGPDQSICIDNTILSAQIPVVGTGVWTLTGGVGILVNPSSNASAVNELSPGANTFTWQVTNGSCPPSSDQMIVFVDQPIDPPDAGLDQTICTGQTMLTALVPDFGVGSWSIVSGTGVITDTLDASSSLTGISIGTTTLRWNVRNGACGGFDDVSIVRSPPPSSSNAGADQAICGTAAQLSGNTPLTGTGLWSILSGTAIVSNPASPNSQVSGLGIGSNALVWTISNGICTPTKDTVVIVVSANPISPEAGPDQSLCSTAGALNADAPVIGIGKWSVVSGGALIADTLNRSSAITNLSAGANVFRWTIINGACTAADQVTITRDLPPSPASAGNDLEICASSTSLNASVPTTGTGIWTILSGTGTLAAAGNATSSLTNLSPGTLLLQWTVSNGVCAASSDQVSILVNSPTSLPNAGTDQTICVSNANLAAAIPVVGTGVWTLVSGAGIIADTLNPSTVVSGLTTGTNVFEFTIKNGVCPALSDRVSISVEAFPTPANAGPDQRVCSDATQLAGNIPVIGTGNWTVVTGSGLFSNPGLATSSVSDLAVGVNVLQWTITNGSCPPDNDQIVIIRDSVPVQANAGSDLAVCNSASISLQGQSPFPGSGVWRLLTGQGTLTDSTLATTAITGLGAGLTVFRWTVTTGACPPTTDDVTINNSLPPTFASAGNDTNLCGTSIQLSAQTPARGNGIWTSENGNVLFSNETQPQTLASNLSVGVNKLIWTVSNGVCPSISDTVSIRVDKNPITPNAGPDQSICSDSVNLSAGTPSSGIGIWTIQAGTGVLSDSTLETSLLSGIQAGVTRLRWTVTNGTCRVFDETEINRSIPPSEASAGNDLSVCVSTAPVTAALPAIGSGNWSLVSGSGLIADSTRASTSVSNLAIGQTTLRWTVTNGSCPPSVDEITLTRQEVPLPADAGADVSMCSDTISLAGNTVGALTGFWQLIGGSGNFAELNNPATLVNGIGTGTNVFSWNIPADGACPATSDEVTITRDIPPSIASVGVDQEVCIETAVILANTPATGTGVWLVIAGNADVADSSSASTTALNLSLGNNVFEWRITNGSCPPSTDQITISRGDTAFAGIDSLICDSVFTLGATVPGSGTGHWIIVSGSATFSDSTQANATIRDLQPGVSVFEWVIVGGSCPDSTDQVRIERRCNIPPVLENDTYTLLEDSTLSSIFLTPGDFDPDSTVLVIDTIPVSGPSNGTITINADGSFVYVPDPNFNGSDTIVIQICDSGYPLPALCGKDTLVMNVDAVNDPPVIVNERIILLMDSTASGNILQNGDFDPDSTNLSIDTIPVGGPTHGIIDFASDGSFVYTPNAGYTGNDTIYITVCDSGFPLPPLCGIDTLIIQINDTINTPPNLTNDSLTILEDQSGSGSILVDDLDPDGTSLRADTIPVSGPNHGTIDINPDGSYTYRPDTNYYGMDTVIIAVCDSGAPLPPLCGNDTLIIRVNPVNDPPLIANEYLNTTPGDSLTGNILDNDTDLETSLILDTIPISGPDHGDITLNPDGSFTYYPDPGFVGTDTIIVTVCDSGFPLPKICLPDTLFITSGAPTFTVDAGPDQTFCGFSTQLQAQPAEPPAAGVWSHIEGTGILADSTSATTSVTNLSVGVHQFVWTITLNGQSVSDTVQLNSNQPATPAFAGEDQSVCGISTELQGNTPSNGTGNWALVSGQGNISDPENPIVQVNNLNLGISVFSWTITNGSCSSVDSVVITSFDDLQVNAGKDSAYCEKDASTLKMTGEGTGVWSVVSGNGIFADSLSATSNVSNLSSGNNTFVFSYSNGPCFISDTVNITLLAADNELCKDNKIFIPEGFSPDADGVNDEFVIYGTAGKRVEIDVYNRYGDRVFSSSNYLNNWNGTSDADWIIAGDRLPESTYYYIIRIDGEEKARKGYLTLWR
jgi:gliding motility-associated-like protein